MLDNQSSQSVSSSLSERPTSKPKEVRDRGRHTAVDLWPIYRKHTHMYTCTRTSYSYNNENITGVQCCTILPLGKPRSLCLWSHWSMLGSCFFSLKTGTERKNMTFSPLSWGQYSSGLPNETLEKCSLAITFPPSKKIALEQHSVLPIMK